MRDRLHALQTEIESYESQIAQEEARLAVDNSAEKDARQEEIDVSTHRFLSLATCSV